MNTGGAHLVLGIEPDIAVFSKALGNGYPIAAIIGKPEIMDAAQKTFISSTNWTERTGFVAAIATIKKHKRLNVGNHLMKIGKMVQEGWKMLSEKHGIPIHIGGIPPLSHFAFEHAFHRADSSGRGGRIGGVHFVIIFMINDFHYSPLGMSL